jgi:methionyl-tRNA synthetase
MPGSSQELLDRLGLEIDPSELRLDQHTTWGTLQPNTSTRRGKSLFPRIDHTIEDRQADEPSRKPLLTLDDFSRMDLRVAEILQAESIPDSKNLLKLEVDLGEKRTVVAGIASHYRPEDLVGRQVVLVANLRPAKLMGIRSEGMILVGSAGGEMVLIAPEKKVKPGSPIH